MSGSRKKSRLALSQQARPTPNEPLMWKALLLMQKLVRPLGCSELLMMRLMSRTMRDLVREFCANNAAPQLSDVWRLPADWPAAPSMDQVVLKYGVQALGRVCIETNFVNAILLLPVPGARQSTRQGTRQGTRPEVLQPAACTPSRAAMSAVFASEAVCNGNTALSLKLSCEHPPCLLGRSIHGEVLTLIADVLRDARVTRRLTLVIDFQITAWVASQLEGLSGLESLKLCRGGTAPSVLVNALRAKPAMTALTLQSCSLSNEEAPLLAMVLREMPLLEKLDLSDNALGDSSMALVAPALPSGLKWLGLEANDMDDAGAGLLASALRGMKGLKHLEIGCNAFGAWANQGSGGALLLSSLEGLELLDLACNSCDLECLADCFKKNPGLKHLTLHGTFHHRAGDGVESLGLHELKLLKHLNIAANLLAAEDGHNAVAQLARTLRKMPWLECLDLSHNEFGAEEVKVLIPALAGMPGLIELDFSGNDLMTQLDWSPAVGLLEALPGLQKLRCEETGIERTALEEMVEMQAHAPNRLVLIARNFGRADVETLDVEALENARIFWG
jgi:hypothetical protein